MAHIPQNAEILKVLGSTHDALEEAKFDSKIDAKGEKIINKAEDVLVDIGEFFAHKNTDNRLQEIFKESARIYKEISGNTEKWTSMKKNLNDIDVEELRTNLNNLQLNLRILALELIRSNAFREDIYDLFSLIIMLFENKAKEIKSGGAIPSTSSSSKSVTFEKKPAKVVKKKKKKPKSAIVQPVATSSSSTSSGHPPLAKEKYMKKTVIKEGEAHHPKTKEGKKVEEKHAKEGMKEGELHHNPKEGKHYEDKIHEYEAKHHHEEELHHQHPKKTVIKEGEAHHPKTKEGKKMEEKHAKEGMKEGEHLHHPKSKEGKKVEEKHAKEGMKEAEHHHHHQPGTTTTTTTTTTSKVKPEMVTTHPDVVNIPITSTSSTTEKELKDGPIIGTISQSYPYYQQQSAPFDIPISSHEAKQKRDVIKESEVPIEVIEDEEFHHHPESKYYHEEKLPKEKKIKEETRSVKEDIPITHAHKEKALVGSDKRFRKVTNKSYSKDEVIDQFNKVLRDISSKPRTKEALISLINIFGIIKEVLVATKSSTSDLSKSVYEHLKKILELTEELIYSVTDYHPKKLHGRIKSLYFSVTKDEELTEFLKSLSDFMKDSVNHPETIGTDESRKTLSKFYSQAKKMAKRKSNTQGLMVKVEKEVLLFLRHLQRDTLIADTRTDIQEFVAMLILDEHGRFSIRPEILRQLKMIIFVTLIQNLRYPLPEITVDKGNTFWMKMRGVVLSMQDILPDKLIASNEGDVIVNLKDFEKAAEIPKFDTARQNIRLKLENMNVKIPSADIEFERKKFPKLHDSGNAAVTIGGNGMDIMLSIYVDTNLDSSKVFELDRVECIIHQLDIKLFDTKHDRMYNTGLKMLKPVLKKNIQNTIQENIIKVLTKVNNLIVKQKSLLRDSAKFGAEKLKRGKEKIL